MPDLPEIPLPPLADLQRRADEQDRVIAELHAAVDTLLQAVAALNEKMRNPPTPASPSPAGQSSQTPD